MSRRTDDQTVAMKKGIPHLLLHKNTGKSIFRPVDHTITGGLASLRRLKQ